MTECSDILCLISRVLDVHVLFVFPSVLPQVGTCSIGCSGYLGGGFVVTFTSAENIIICMGFLESQLYCDL